MRPDASRLLVDPTVVHQVVDRERATQVGLEPAADLDHHELARHHRRIVLRDRDSNREVGERMHVDREHPGADVEHADRL